MLRIPRTPEYKPSGRGSRAWWLQAIKRHGGTAGVSQLFLLIKDDHDTNIAYDDMQNVIDDLESNSLIQRKKIAGNKKRLYGITSLGHRYLNERREELIQNDEDSSEAESGSYHSVPESPELIKSIDINDDSQEIDTPPDNEPMGTRHHRPNRPVIASAEIKAGTELRGRVDAADTKNPGMIGLAAMAFPDPKERVVQVTSSDLGLSKYIHPASTIAQHALHEILVERFAHHVSASDLIDKIEQLEKR